MEAAKNFSTLLNNAKNNKKIIIYLLVRFMLIISIFMIYEMLGGK